MIKADFNKMRFPMIFVIANPQAKILKVSREQAINFEYEMFEKYCATCEKLSPGEPYRGYVILNCENDFTNYSAYPGIRVFYLDGALTPAQNYQEIIAAYLKEFPDSELKEIRENHEDGGYLNRFPDIYSVLIEDMMNMPKNRREAIFYLPTKCQGFEGTCHYVETFQLQRLEKTVLDTNIEVQFDPRLKLKNEDAVSLQKAMRNAMLSNVPTPLNLSPEEIRILNTYIGPYLFRDFFE